MLLLFIFFLFEWRKQKRPTKRLENVVRMKLNLKLHP